VPKRLLEGTALVFSGKNSAVFQSSRLTLQVQWFTRGSCHAILPPLMRVVKCKIHDYSA